MRWRRKAGLRKFAPRVLGERSTMTAMVPGLGRFHSGPAAARARRTMPAESVHSETGGKLSWRRRAMKMMAMASARAAIPEFGEEKRAAEAVGIGNDYNG